MFRRNEGRRRAGDARARLGRRAEAQRRVTNYVIPVLMGLGGLVFAQQFESLPLRAGTLLISIALPLYAGGNLIARYRTSQLERFIMLSGILMLIVGAGISFFTGPGDIPVQLMQDPDIARASRVLGLGSLFLGLFVVMFSVMRTGEDSEEITERFWILAEHISDGFVLSTGDGVIRLVNQSFLDIFGVTREMLIGNNVTTLTERFDMAPVRDHLRRRARGISSEYEVRIQVNGREKVLLFNGAPITNRHGKHTATIATVRDITEQVALSRRVEQYAQGLQRLVEEQTRRLRTSEERLRNLLLSMNEGFVTVDGDNRIQFVNPRFASLLGMTEELLLGVNIMELVETAGRPRLLNLLASTERAEGGARQELEFVDIYGKPVPVVVAAAVLPGGETAADAGFSLVATSIAEIRKMQQKLLARARELERANEELRLHDRAKDSFLSNVSHELRTPLSTIQGYIELLKTGGVGELTEAQLNVVRIAERNGERLLALINQLLEYSRMQIKGVTPVLSLVSPQALIGEAVAAVHPDALAKNLVVETSAAGPPAFVWVDRDKFSQVLGILLNNAVKFTPGGGTISVTLQAQEGGGAAITVRDTGIGIAPEHHARIFDRFFQVDSSKARKYEGAGLGLSIAKGIVDAHGGLIRIDSAPGKGSAFTVTLPSAAFPGEEGVQVAPALRDQRLLVLSAREETALALACVRGVGKVAWLPAGKESLRQLGATDADVILMDEVADDVLGRTALAILRGQPATREKPVVVFTMESLFSAAPLREQFPRTEFINKPFSVAELGETVERLVHGSDGFDGAFDPLAAYVKSDQKRCVFVVDADPGMLEFVSAGLRNRNIACMGMVNHRQALEAVLDVRPDVILLDADVPAEVLRESVRALRAEPMTENIPLYMMTGTQSADVEGMGVMGVIRKPFTIGELNSIIQNV
ncbi:MAG: PAS domain S-box protein [Candidatus Hydrogenedentes bacterium]|nr:PAS domain S-box protein [Candidatus Hydrogenedentota bacterium]